NSHNIHFQNVYTGRVFIGSEKKSYLGQNNVIIDNLPISHVNSPKFSDINKLTKEFQSAIKWLYKYGITTGTDKTHYSPNKVVTRQQMATFLYRQDGDKDWTNINCGFVDVNKLSTEAKKAICFLKETGRTTGTDSTHFSPQKAITRQQMVVFLVRFFAHYYSKEFRVPCGFLDTKSLDLFSQVSICYAKAAGITTGTDKTHFSPKKAVTRGQMAAFLKRENNWDRDY
ncbi:MAG: S-layer homology domain-containing protein, partial [Bifidobacteriaceae bacterium]|nr:S-layer homology domain-containing protein [Bifidobacteriaceae bacterium]